MSETAQRVAVAAVGIPLAVAAVYLGGWILAILLAAIAALGALEFYRMAGLKDGRPLTEVGAVTASAFVLVAAVSPESGPVGFGYLLAIATLVIATLSIWMRGVQGQPLLAISTTLTGAVYAGALLSFGLMLRHLPGVESAWHGTALVFAPVLLTWTSDTFAYFAGRAWGRHKLIPRVSPGKTVEGAVGAVVGSVAVGAGYAVLLQSFGSYVPTLFEGALFGLAISVVAQVGDLVESLLKRDCGVKDSGTLLPGHGGALDRFDSLLFTLPFAYLFLRYWVGSTGGG